MRKKQSGEGGFTLIELLIVIVILGILAAIVVFAVGGITDKGDASACKSDFKTVEVAAEALYAKTSAYPTGADSAARLQALKTANLIRSIPSSTKYTIAITDDNGTVTATGACTLP